MWGRDIWGVSKPHARLSGEGTHTGILPEADQEHIGHITAEYTANRSSLQRDGRAGGHRNPLLRRLHQWLGVQEGVNIREGGGMDTLIRRVVHSGAFKNFWEEVFIQSLLHEAERLPMCRVMRCTKAHSWWSRFFRLEKSICGCPRTTLDNASNECVHPSTFSDIHAFLDS